jgi:hypothetical protein
MFAISGVSDDKFTLSTPQVRRSSLPATHVGDCVDEAGGFNVCLDARLAFPVNESRGGMRSHESGRGRLISLWTISRGLTYAFARISAARSASSTPVTGLRSKRIDPPPSSSSMARPAAAPA